MPTQACALAMAAEAIGDRWTLLILREAFYGVMRYDDIRADLDAPRAVLSDRLNRLVARGLLEKRAYQEPGRRRRHAYALTDKGRGLAVTLIALTQWSETHILGTPGPVDIIDSRTGTPVTATLMDQTGTPVPAERVTVRVRGEDDG
ncbi:MAG: winged helix-turn-helix transcriptional regulator [Rhodothalassiaceae bacterium]